MNIDSRFSDVRETEIGEQVFNAFYNAGDDVIINAKKNYLLHDNRLSLAKGLSRFNNKIITDHLILGPSTELYNIDGDSIYLFDQHNFYNLTAAFVTPVDFQVRKVLYDKPTLYLVTDRNIYQCENPLNIIKHMPD